MAQSVTGLTLDLSSGHDIDGSGLEMMKPSSGLWAHPAVYLTFSSLFPLAPPSLLELAFSLSLKIKSS